MISPNHKKELSEEAKQELVRPFIEEIQEKLEDLRRRRKELTRQVMDLDTEIGMLKLEKDKLCPPRILRK